MQLMPTTRPFTLALLGLASCLAQAGPAAADQQDCPWIVQPADHLVDSGEVPRGSWGIRFDEVAYPFGTLYAFSVADQEVAWRIAESARNQLPDLSDGALRLETIEMDAGTLYRIDARTAVPETLFLVAAAGPVEQLDAIGARIEPERAIAVSQLAARTRGASDISGELPDPVVPGFLIARANAEAEPPLQICAYEVALR